MKMKIIEITKIELQQSGELSVTPIENYKNIFQLIYRAATGVQWDEKSRCFISPIPKEWSHLDWYPNIVTSVMSEMGVMLQITQNTVWLNIQDSLKSEIANYTPIVNT